MMNKFSIFSLVFFLFSLLPWCIQGSFLSADTHIPYGNVSGIWTIEGSPYIIDGHINVPVDSTLVIEPGVNVIFSDQYYFRIYGKLLSEGTLNDTINFTVQDTISDLAGIYFLDTDITLQDSSKVKFCKFDPGFLSFNNSSNIVFTNSVVINGGGVFCSEANPILADLLISNNTTEYYGGGIYCTDSSNPSLINVTISGNTAAGAGGIWCNNNSNPTLDNVSIENNSPNGISCTYSSSPILINVTINGNEGGGIACFNNSNPILDSVIISNNTVWGGLFCINSSPILTNVIISGNSGGEFGGGIYFEGTGSLLLQEVIITGNSALWGGGLAVIGYGEEIVEIVMVNGIVADNYADDDAGGIFCHVGVNLSLTNVTVSENSVDAGGIVGGIGCEFDCNLNIINSIVWNNESMDIFLYGYGCESDITYSDIGGEGWPGIGNINTDPLFADDEFHLSEYSPCIDAGNPDSLYYDIEDPYNPGYALYPAMGTIINDMGTYGGHGYYEPPVSADEELITEKPIIKLNNYPNPFNPFTTIKFELPYHKKNGFLEIYNIRGQKIDEIAINSQQTAVIWNAEGFASGIYLYKLNIKDSPIKKMILIK